MRTRAPEVRAVYNDIMATRKTDWINNFSESRRDDRLLKYISTILLQFARHHKLWLNADC